MTNQYCPICGKENMCMCSGEHGFCWCDKEEFPNQIFEWVPEDSRRKHCICKACLNKFKAEGTIGINENDI